MKKTKSISLSKFPLLVGALFVMNIVFALADDAVTKIVCVDFENDTIGTLYPDVQDKIVNDTFYLYVEEDPTNAVNETTGQVNKVLHAENTGAGMSNYVLPVFDITLPQGLTVGDMNNFIFDMYCLSDNSSYNYIRYYVFPGDDDSWMNWGWGTYECDPQVSTIDAIGGQENKQKWVTCSIDVRESMAKNSNYETMKTWNHFKFSFGEENNGAHYYIDNIGFSLGEVGELSISSAGYATYYVEDEYTMPDGVVGSTVTGVGSQAGDDGYYLTMPWEYESGKTVPAGTALVLEGNEGTYTYAITSTGETAPADNLLLGSTTSTETTGPNGQTTGYVYYELTNGSSGIGFYYGAENGAKFTSEANKAWLPLTESQSRNARFLGFGDGDTTGISSVETNDGAKVSGIYTIQGVRVSDMSQKGIYIVDGRKILVK